MDSHGSEEFELVQLKTTSFRICEDDTMRRVNGAVGIILDYFDKKTGGQRLACRNDFDPLELPDLVPRICLFEFERNAEGKIVDAIMRLQGSEIARRYRDVMGKSVREQRIEEVNERIFFLSNRISETGKPIVAQAERLSEEMFHLTMSVLYVPLSEDNVTVNSALLYIETS